MTKPKTPAKPSKPKIDDRLKRPETGPKTELTIKRDESRTWHQQMADSSLSPVTLGAITSKVWAEKTMGEIGLNEAVAVVRQRADAVASGDLDEAKAMLIAQATALDAIFNEMARRAAALLKTKPDGTWSFSGETMETVTRIAFKAQNQCRGTLQTLGELVNPRSVAFIKQAPGSQANVATGNQLVNNGQDHAPAPARETEKSSNELKELPDARMDEGAQGTAGGIGPCLATVDAINRAEVGGRQGESIQKQPKARRAVSAGH